MSIQAKPLCRRSGGKPIKCTLTRDESFACIPSARDSHARQDRLRRRRSNHRRPLPHHRATKRLPSVGGKVLERAAGHAAARTASAIDIEALAVYTTIPRAAHAGSAPINPLAIEQLLNRLADKSASTRGKSAGETSSIKAIASPPPKTRQNPSASTKTLLAVKDIYRSAKFRRVAAP